MHIFPALPRPAEAPQPRSPWVASTGRDCGARPCGHRPLSDPQGLLTCSHGSHLQFLFVGRYRYFELIRRRLRELSGRHLHLGALPEPVVAQFRQNLAAEGVDPSRFEHLPAAPSVWATLRDSRVDIVMPPMAVPGAQGLVDTLGAGLPMLVHASALLQPELSPDLIYPEALRWRTPEELVEVLRGLDAPMLQAHAAAARAHYERWHLPRWPGLAANDGWRAAWQQHTRSVNEEACSPAWRGR